jgi:multicomponent K+:H+ antiporter subunit D
LVTGLPPLPGFVAKFALLSTALAAARVGAVPWTTWAFFAAILLSGFASLIALSRVGIRLFWSIAARATPRLRLLEAAPVAALVLLCLALTVAAGPVAGYLDSAARSLHQPDTYVRAVLSERSNESR